MQSKHFTLKWSWANRPIGMPDRPQTMNTPSYNMCTLARALIYFVPRKCSIRFNIIVFYAVHMTLVGAGALTLRIHSYSLRDGRSIANVLFVCCISRSSLTNLFSLFLLFHIFSLFLPRFFVCEMPQVTALLCIHYENRSSLFPFRWMACDAFVWSLIFTHTGYYLISIAPDRPLFGWALAYVSLFGSSAERVRQ